MKSRWAKFEFSNWAVVGLVMSALFIGIVTGAFILTFWPGRTSPAPTITKPSYELKVNSLRTDDQGDQIYRPGAGYRYYIVDITFTNAQNQALALAPVVQTYLEDSAGTKYEMAPAPLTNPFAAGPLEPGASRQGELSYEVPISAQNLQFVFDPGNGLKRTVVKLQLVTKVP